MKKITLMLLAAFFIAVGSAQAHCGKCGIGDGPKGEDHEAMMKERMGKMTADLGLSDEQKSKVEAIMKDKMDKKKAIMEEKQKAMEALHEDFKTQLKGILTGEQMTKWEAMKDDHKGKCPMCEKAGEGKLCPMCKMHKGEKGEKGKDGEGHDHDDKE